MISSKYLSAKELKEHMRTASSSVVNPLYTTLIYNLHPQRRRLIYVFRALADGYERYDYVEMSLEPPFTYEEHERCPDGYIFVFGSNLAGRHGRGAALYAREHFGAQLGVGVGLTGQAYALPTKDTQLKTLPLDRIAGYVEAFIQKAVSMPETFFWLTPVGTGLAGYTHDDIAPLFQRKVLENIVYPSVWYRYLFT